MTAGDAKPRHPPPGTLAGGAPPPAATSAQSPPTPAVPGSSSGWGPRRFLKRAICGVTSAASDPDTEARLVEDADDTDPLLTLKEDYPCPAGLLNVGDTCYFNTVVQVLFHTPAFRASVLAYRSPGPLAHIDSDSDDSALTATKRRNADDIVSALQRLFGALEDPGGYTYADPTDLVDILRDKARGFEFDADGQQDAHEFLRFLLENVSTALIDAHAALEKENPERSASPQLKRLSESVGHSPRPLKRPKTVVLPNGVAPVSPRFPVEEEVIIDGSHRPPTDETASAGPRVGKPSVSATTKPSVHPASSTTAAPVSSLSSGTGGEETGTKSSNRHGSTAAEVPSLQSSPTRDPESTQVSVNECNRAKNKAPDCDPDLVRSIFGGESVTSTRCSECETASSRPESFLDLSIPVRLGRSLSGSLTAMAAGDMLNGRDKYACELCQTKTEAERRFYLSKLPPVLTVHLKLFQFTATQAGAKIPVSTPCPLNMRFDRWCTRKCAESAPEYMLSAAIVHAGGCSTSGHYYAYIFNQKSRQWYLFDDSNVTAVSEADIKKTLFSSAKSKKTGYLLFYSAISD